MNRAILTCAALGLASIGLASCGQEPTPVAETAPDGFPGIEVSDARLILPAVKGNPGAVYFTVNYSGDNTAMIRTVFVEGAAMAMMHETQIHNGKTYMNEIPQLAVTKGEPLVFEPGARHVMAMDLAETLQPGDTAEVTLTFVGGDKYSFPAQVRGAGDER